MYGLLLSWLLLRSLTSNAEIAALPLFPFLRAPCVFPVQTLNDPTLQDGWLRFASMAKQARQWNC
jgi:hypothetical protein